MPLLTIAFLSFNSFRDYFAVWSVSRIICIVDFSFSFVLFSFKISTNCSLKASEKAKNKVFPWTNLSNSLRIPPYKEAFRWNWRVEGNDLRACSDTVFMKIRLLIFSNFSELNL